jgi:hypothetical protein
MQVAVESYREPANRATSILERHYLTTRAARLEASGD